MSEELSARNEEQNTTDHQSDKQIGETKRLNLVLIGLFAIFFIFGWIALGPIQWGNIPLNNTFKIIYKVGVPVLFLILTILAYKIEQLQKYWKTLFGFLLGSVSFCIVWGFSYLIDFNTDEYVGVALAKLVESLFLILPILAITLLMNRNVSTLYLKKGKWKLGLVIGVGGFIVFILISFPVSSSLFGAQDLTVNKVLSWTPWILIFIFSNAIMEEIIYRGLFLWNYENHFKKWIVNLLQALIFALIHFGVAYTADAYISQTIFLFVSLGLGLLWGYLVQKTDSLLASILLHAGADFLVIIAIFSQL